MKPINSIKTCEQSGCGKKIIFMLNTASGKYVPVDYDSLTRDEKNIIEGIVEAVDTSFNDKDYIGEPVLGCNDKFCLCYNNNHHISHFKTCTNPNKFSKRS